MTVDRSEIGFLNAQEGLFTYIGGADANYLLDGAWPRYERLLPAGSLVKHTLAANAIWELKRLLFAEGISKAHLMPTHDNVTQALRDVWRHRVSMSRRERSS